MNLLYIVDSVIQTGFARVGHNLTPELQRLGWTVSQLGLNCIGDPHPYPYDIYRADAAGDGLGCNRQRHICELTKADVVLVQNDPWNIVRYIEQRAPHVPMVAYVPIDAANQPASARMNALARWWAGGRAVAFTVRLLRMPPFRTRRPKIKVTIRRQLTCPCPPTAYPPDRTLRSGSCYHQYVRHHRNVGGCSTRR